MKSHVRTVVNQNLQGCAGPYNDIYGKCLSAMCDDLTTGHMKRCAASRDASIGRKLEEDRRLIKDFPSVEVLQEAVTLGYMTMKLVIEHGVKQQGYVTKAQRALMNQVIALGYHFDTIGGRKWELEHADYIAVEHVLRTEEDFLICQNHKTRNTYGDIAKLITPGFKAALKCYNEAPRPDDFKYFLVPAIEGGQCVSMTTALEGACKKFLSEEKVWPTNLLTRKWVHKRLVALTKDEEKLKKMMVVIDAHSMQMIDKHYLLKDPEDDVALARALVECIYGESVKWPTDDDIAKKRETNPAWYNMAMCIANGTVGAFPKEDDQDQVVEYEEEDCDDEQEMEDWDFGYIFGIRPPGYLETIPLTAGDIEEQSVPIEDAVNKNKGKRNNGKKEDAKEKSKNEKKSNKEQRTPAGPSIAAEEIKPPKKRKTCDEKKKLYEQYTVKKSPGDRSRNPVDALAHDYMEDKVREWQEHFFYPRTKLPFHNEWYLDLRVEMIDKGLLCKAHSQDVVKSYLQGTYLKRMKECVD